MQGTDCRLYFYPRPPRGGRRVCRAGRLVIDLFLSTPSARRATGQFLPGWRFFTNFYPRPPRGGRQRRSKLHRQLRRISIHALREEGDNMRQLDDILIDLFLSTPSARRATGFGRFVQLCRNNFYPRPPRGGRPQPRPTTASRTIFLSTPSARRATGAGRHPRQRYRDFYPRPPRGGRPSWYYHYKCND